MKLTWDCISVLALLAGCSKPTHVDVMFANLGNETLRDVQVEIGGHVARAGGMGSKTTATVGFFDTLAQQAVVEYQASNGKVSRRLGLRNLADIATGQRTTLVVWIAPTRNPDVIVEARKQPPDPLLGNESEIPVELRSSKD